jgi:hypothetical protein
LHRFELELRLDKIVGADDAAQIEFSVRWRNGPFNVVFLRRHDAWRCADWALERPVSENLPTQRAGPQVPGEEQ